jgi:tRNA nucleotidyltransferase (CCA-adding enzyme)
MAIALRPERFGELLDPFHGRRDLNRGLVRVLHGLSFFEDPTRIFRAVRFEQRLKFRMDARTEHLARGAVADDALAKISPERLRRELQIIFGERNTIGCLRRLANLGVLDWLAGRELTPDWELVQRVPAALEWWERHGERAERALVFTAALLAILGAVDAAAVAGERLRLSPADASAVQDAIRTLESSGGPLMAAEATPAAVTAALRAHPPEAIVLLRAANLDQPGRSRLEQYAAEWRSVRLEITGNDLLAAGVRKGPELGQALRAALEAKLNGEIAGREAELEYARRAVRKENG